MTMCSSIVILAVWLMFYLRYQSRTETIYQSAAKTEGSVQVTQRYAGVTEIQNFSSPLEVAQSIPPSGNTISNVRQRLVHDIHDRDSVTNSRISLRPSIAGSSTTTLSKGNWWVTEGEYYDGVIEFKGSKDTKTLVDPQTGETLHLSRWKSRKRSRDEKDEDQDFGKGDVHRIVTQIGVGSVFFGGGTAATKALYEKTQGEPNQQPQQIGIMLASRVANDPASVGDALKGTVFGDICI